MACNEKKFLQERTFRVNLVYKLRGFPPIGNLQFIVRPELISVQEKDEIEKLVSEIANQTSSNCYDCDLILN